MACSTAFNVTQSTNSTFGKQDGGFCHDALWDTQLLVTSAWPRFTDCFRHTVLTYLPCAFLWLPLPFHLHSLARDGRKALPTSPLAVTKLLLSMGLCLISFNMLLNDVSQGHATSPAEYLAYILRAGTYAAAGLLAIYERKHRVTSSGIPLLLWWTFLLCDVVTLLTEIMTKEYDKDLLKFSLFALTYGFQVCLFLLNCFADNVGLEERGPRTTPETTASFLCKILYWWTTRTIYRGWRRDLTEDDLFDLNPRDSCKTLVPVFEKLWAAEKKRFRLKRNKDRQNSSSRYDLALFDLSQSDSRKSEEQQRLLDSDDLERKAYGGQDDGLKGDNVKNKARPSLLRVMILMTLNRLLLGFSLKITSDIFLLSGPVWLSLLIANAEHPDEGSSWKGYSLSAILFVTTIIKSVLFNSCFWQSTIIGMQMKTTLIAAIYKKALTMNSASRKDSTAGEIVNLMSVDCQRVQDIWNFFFYAWATPVQIVMVVAILYQYIGPSVFAGMAVLLLTVPFNTYIASLQERLQDENLKMKDERLRLTNEALSGMKVLKLYAWEHPFTQSITNIRNREIGVLFKIACINACSCVVFYISPFLVTLATLGLYVNVSDENRLDASKTFVTLSIFSLLTVPLQLLAAIISLTVQAVVSIDRINAFLSTTDLNPNNVNRDSENADALTIENGSFSWDPDSPPTLRNISLKVPEGSVVAVVGPVGCGKSSLMSAILGEMEKISGTVNLQGSVAYVAQQAWIQNATVRDNILFGKPYRKKKYESVIRACALERDLTILSAGDMTEIGEKGINLSGGQKQRVSLARAVYSGADVYILDDPLSAVDSHVGKHIFNHVISRQGILKNKTRILVTHGSHWLPMVDSIVVMETGHVSEFGSYQDLMEEDGAFANFIKTYLHAGEVDPQRHLSEIDEMSDIATSGDEMHQPSTRSALSRRLSMPYGESTAAKSLLSQSQVTVYDEEEGDDRKGGRLVQDETMEQGKVKMAVFGKYVKAAGPWSILTSFSLFAAFQIVSAGANFWLTSWTEDRTLANQSLQGSPEFKSTQDFYLGVFGAFGVAQVLLLGLHNSIYWVRMVIAARRLHQMMLASIFRSPMSFFDTTPLGRIMNRFSRDLEVVDNNLPMIFRDLFACVAMTVVILVVISINTPYFLIIALPLTIFYVVVQSIYIPTSRQLKRIESVTRSPIYSHFSETISGGATIRSYGVEPRFIGESQRRVDRNQSFYYISLATNRWLGTNLEFLSDVVVLGAALLAVLTPGISGATVGLSVSYAIQVSSQLVWMVRMMSEMETNIVSVERLKDYSELTPEADWIIPHKRPVPQWPQNGEVEFKRYKTRYRPGLDLVLRGITCTFMPGEKIGIVGRTGAGKSSLALALFRLIESSEGGIFVDGIQISDIGLHDVRSRLTILPQDPVLFFGSLRMNLDPINQYSDDQLWDSLTSAHLKDFVQNLPQGLDYQVGEEGQSLSVGQRQLVCLARALLKKTNILILDEATAAVDMETDKLIQDTIRAEFEQCTIISIAHRLNTIMDYDRIMVLDNGFIKELDTPVNLLNNPDTVFFSMAREANLI